MDFKLGQDILTSDNKKVGEVDRVVIHPESNEVVALIAHQGHMFGEDRIVDIIRVGTVEENGKVHLSVDSNAAANFPHFIRTDFVAPTTAQTHTFGSQQGAVLMPGGGSQQFGYTQYDPMAGSMFGPAPISAPNVEAVSNLPEGSLTINHGTEVQDIDGKSVGTIDDVIVDDDENITGFIVHQGTFFKHSVRIPNEWVAGVAHDHIRLSVSAAEAEEKGAIN